MRAVGFAGVCSFKNLATSIPVPTRVSKWFRFQFQISYSFESNTAPTLTPGPTTSSTSDFDSDQDRKESHEKVIISPINKNDSDLGFDATPVPTSKQ